MTATETLSREEAAYAHLCSLAEGDLVSVTTADGTPLGQATVLYPQRCSAATLADNCVLLDLGGNRGAVITVRDLAQGARIEPAEVKR